MPRRPRAVEPYKSVYLNPLPRSIGPYRQIWIDNLGDIHCAFYVIPIDTDRIRLAVIGSERSNDLFDAYTVEIDDFVIEKGRNKEILLSLARFIRPYLDDDQIDLLWQTTAHMFTVSALEIVKQRDLGEIMAWLDETAV